MDEIYFPDLNFDAAFHRKLTNEYLLTPINRLVSLISGFLRTQRQKLRNFSSAEVNQNFSSIIEEIFHEHLHRLLFLSYTIRLNSVVGEFYGLSSYVHGENVEEATFQGRNNPIFQIFLNVFPC